MGRRSEHKGSPVEIADKGDWVAMDAGLVGMDRQTEIAADSLLPGNSVSEEARIVYVAYGELLDSPMTVGDSAGHERPLLDLEL